MSKTAPSIPRLNESIMMYASSVNGGEVGASGTVEYFFPTGKKTAVGVGVGFEGSLGINSRITDVTEDHFRSVGYGGSIIPQVTASLNVFNYLRGAHLSLVGQMGYSKFYGLLEEKDLQFGFRTKNEQISTYNLMAQCLFSLKAPLFGDDGSLNLQLDVGMRALPALDHESGRFSGWDIGGVMRFGLAAMFY